MTQKELAHAIGVDESYISKIRRGHKRPGRGIRARAALALGMPAEALFPTDKYPEIHGDTGERTEAPTPAANGEAAPEAAATRR